MLTLISNFQEFLFEKGQSEGVYKVKKKNNNLAVGQSDNKATTTLLQNNDSHHLNKLPLVTITAGGSSKK